MPRTSKAPLDIEGFMDAVLTQPAPHAQFERDRRHFPSADLARALVRHLIERDFDARIADRVTWMLAELDGADAAVAVLNHAVDALPGSVLQTRADDLLRLLTVSDAAARRLRAVLPVERLSEAARNLLWEAKFARRLKSWIADGCVERAMVLLGPEKLANEPVSLPPGWPEPSLEAHFGLARRPPKGQRRYLEVTATLLDVEDPPWRRFLIDATATFAQVHAAMQAASGTWLDCHLFAFKPDAEQFAMVAATELSDEPFEYPVAWPTSERLVNWLEAAGTDRIVYEYDYGDSWLVELHVEALRDLPEHFHRRLLDGAMAFPPEDCGGYHQIRAGAGVHARHGTGGTLRRRCRSGRVAG